MSINGERNTATREIIECDRCGKRCQGWLSVRTQEFTVTERPIGEAMEFGFCRDCQKEFLSWCMEVQNRMAARYGLVGAGTKQETS